MANKQKAWRKAGKGRAHKAATVKILPVAAPLMQALLLRAGAIPTWGAAPDEHSRALDSTLGLCEGGRPSPTGRLPRWEGLKRLFRALCS